MTISFVFTCPMFFPLITEEDRAYYHHRQFYPTIDEVEENRQDVIRDFHFSLACLERDCAETLHERRVEHQHRKLELQRQYQQDLALLSKQGSL